MTSAPSRIMKIIPVVTAVPNSTSLNWAQRMPPSTTAKRPVPTVPMAAASVGVNQPA